VSAPNGAVTRALRRLTPERQKTLTAAEAAARALRSAEARVEVERLNQRRAVRAALDAGVPTILVADRLGVSVSRVYQIRDAISTQ